MANERILIAEDDADMRELLQEVLEAAGYEALPAASGAAAISMIMGITGSTGITGITGAGEAIDLVITDVLMPGVRGDEVLGAVRRHRAETPVIVITAFGSVEQAVEMVKAGAFQYLTKPFPTSELLDMVSLGLERSVAQREHARLRRQMPALAPRLIGASKPMRRLLDLIARTGRSASNVLITGESGTGKELVAQSIHALSARAGQFVPVNCAAIPADLIEAELFGHTGQAFTGARQARPGLFETAAGGTLFLDEIGELPLAVQPKLLRTLQEGSIRRVGANTEQAVNVRVIAATNRDLDLEVAEGRFRRDLYWRLNVIHLDVPSLRDRAFDIPLLVEHFLGKAAETAGRQPPDVLPETLAILTAYAWPGNVRELENALARAVALADGALLRPEDLPERIRRGGAGAAFIARASARGITLREMERAYILETMRKTGGNKSRAAEILGLDRKTLYRKLDEYAAEGISNNGQEP
ncbi:MAG: sigma-54-dependent transcriptional regulator [Blastocatellia bacterium]